MAGSKVSSTPAAVTQSQGLGEVAQSLETSEFDSDCLSLSPCPWGNFLNSLICTRGLGLASIA